MNGAEKYNIENISESSDNIVKMALSLGVLEQKHETIPSKDVIISSHKNQDPQLEVEDISPYIRNTIKNKLFLDQPSNNNNIFHHPLISEVQSDSGMDDMCDDQTPTFTQFSREELGFEPVIEVAGGGYDAKEIVYSPLETSNEEISMVEVKRTRNVL